MSVAFIAGSGKNIGLGHLKRCISIANELKKMCFNVEFVDDESIGRKTDGSGKKYKMLVIDKYDLDEKILLFYKKQCDTLVRMDDASPVIQDRISDMIINGNPYGTKELYDGFVREDCYIIAGPEFVPMDTGFSFARKRYRIRNRVRNVTVTLGGTHDDYTYLICQTILKSTFVPHLTVLNGERLAKRFNYFDHKKLTLLPVVDDIRHVFLNSDVAICSSGSTCWQLSAIGVPYIVFQRANNQSLAFKYIRDSKIAIALDNTAVEDGSLEDAIMGMNEQTRKLMAERSRRIIDCRGAIRIAQTLKPLLT